MQSVSELPFEITAIELSKTAAAYARRSVPSATVLEHSVEDAPFGACSFDCISMIAVLEHVKDPMATIEILTGWLAPGGCLLIQVPYTMPYIRVKRWLPWLPVFIEAPRHLFDFSPRTLPAYLGRFGYSDIKAEIARPYSSNGPIGTGLIWGVKGIGLALYALTGGRYIYPFASAIVVHAIAPDRTTSAREYA